MATLVCGRARLVRVASDWTGDEGVGVDERPVTRYAKARDGVRIAYQVTGDGPLNVLLPPGGPIDLAWDEPGFARFARRLGGFSRVLMFDPRGAGASSGDFGDGLVEETRHSDVTSLLDAAGCLPVVMIATDVAGPGVIRYAAHHPERAKALVLVDTFAYYGRDDDYPWGAPPEAVERWVAVMVEAWGRRKTSMSSRRARPETKPSTAWLARSQRLGTPVDQYAALLQKSFLLDVRALLPTLAVPTLVLHRVGNAPSRSAPVAIWPNTFPVPSTSSFPATTQCSSSAIPMRSSMRSKSSSPVAVRHPKATSLPRRSCLPTGRLDRTVRPHGSPQMDRADRQARCDGSRHLGALPGP